MSGGIHCTVYCVPVYCEPVYCVPVYCVPYTHTSTTPPQMSLPLLIPPARWRHCCSHHTSPDCLDNLLTTNYEAYHWYFLPSVNIYTTETIINRQTMITWPLSKLISPRNIVSDDSDLFLLTFWRNIIYQAMFIISTIGGLTNGAMTYIRDHYIWAYLLFLFVLIRFSCVLIFVILMFFVAVLFVFLVVVFKPVILAIV